MKHADPNSLTITLAAEQIERLDEAVQAGDYASRQEIILAALRLWEEHQIQDADRVVAWHRQEHEDGLASGLAEDLSPEMRLARIRSEFALRD